MDKRYQVFVSSTFTDLKEERKAIIESLLNAKYIPAGMEMFAASNDEQFKYIKKIIDTCDYYVLIIGARYGTVNLNTGISYTEQEFDYAVSKNIPVLVFLHNDPYNLPKDKRDDDKREQLNKFIDKTSKNRLCKMWNTSSELIASVIISLGEEVSDNPQLGWTRGTVHDNEELLTQLNSLRIEKEKTDKEIIRLKDIISNSNNKIENLACGIDLFLVKGRESVAIGYRNGIREYNDVERQANLTWDDIFSAIGPYLYSYKSYSVFTSDLKEGINAMLKGKTHFSSLNVDCVQTIKIQLDVLGLININASKSTNGGVIEFIGMTKKGKQYLLQLKSVKKE